MKARRVDSNQSQIVSALRQIPGVSVAVTSGLPNFCDLVIGYQKKSYLIEIKDGKKRPSEKKLKKSQEYFRDEWTGQWAKCENLEEILKAIGITK